MYNTVVNVVFMWMFMSSIGRCLWHMACIGWCESQDVLDSFHEPPDCSFVDPWPKMSCNKEISCTKKGIFLRQWCLVFKGTWYVSQCHAIDVIGNILAMRRKDNLWFMQLKNKKSARSLPSPGPFSMREGEKFGWKMQRPGFAWANGFFKAVHLVFSFFL